jgi:hypothetical protein
MHGWALASAAAASYSGPSPYPFCELCFSGECRRCKMRVREARQQFRGWLNRRPEARRLAESCRETSSLLSSHHLPPKVLSMVMVYRVEGYSAV